MVQQNMVTLLQSLQVQHPLEKLDLEEDTSPPARTSYLHGSTRLAWVYKSSVGPQVQRGSTSLAWVSKASVGQQV